MKILYIVKYIAQYGGLDRILSYKMNYLSDKLGYEVYLLTYEQGDHPISFPLSSNIKHTDIDVRFFTRYNCSLVERIYQYFKMRSIFKYRLIKQVDSINPDIIIAETYSYSILDIIINQNKKTKIIIESHIEMNSILKQNDYINNIPLKLISKLYDIYIKFIKEM